MKRSFYLIVALLLGSLSVSAQKYAFIDTEYIVSKIAKFQTYSNQIDKKSNTYQQEVTNKGEKVQRLYDEYQNKANNLSDAEKSKIEKRIMEEEKQAMELGRKYFGPEGEIAQLKEQLLDPFYDQIYEAAKTIALKQDYGAVIDRATATGVIFAHPKYDISDEIIRIINK